MTDKQKTWYWMKCIPWVMKYSFRWMLLEHSVSEKREYSFVSFVDGYRSILPKFFLFFLPLKNVPSTLRKMSMVLTY